MKAKSILLSLLFACSVPVFVSCSSDDDNVPTEVVEAQNFSKKLAGSWVYTQTFNGKVTRIETLTFSPFDAKEVKNHLGVGMTFYGSLHTASQHGEDANNLYEFDYFYQVEAAQGVVKAWGKSEDGLLWGNVLYQEYRIKFNEDGSLSVTDKYGTEKFVRK